MSDANNSSRKNKQADSNKQTETAKPKRPFDIKLAARRLRKAVEPYPKAALFELYASGHQSVFELLVACMISIRTKDEITLPTSLRLFEKARTPAELTKLSVEELDKLIGDCAFHKGKAENIYAIALGAVKKHNGELPGDPDVLTSFKGVGPKCANLAIGIACGKNLIGVDSHIHRVTNRWGLVKTKTPEQTMDALMEKLPKRYWVEINALLVPFGKHICVGVSPKCSTCPLLEMCQQVDVKKHR
ncbi:MAG: endonuclease III domain-containing protein [Gemmataceae bacterium]